MSKVPRLPIKWNLQTWLRSQYRAAARPAERFAFQQALHHLAEGDPARAASAVPKRHRPTAKIFLRAHLEEPQGELQGEEDPILVTRVSVLMNVLEDVRAAYHEIPCGGAKACLHRAAHMLLDLTAPPLGIPRPRARVRPGFYRQEKHEP